MFALFLGPLAKADWPMADLLIGKRAQEVRILWVPVDWPSGLEGYVLMRSPVNTEEWTQLGGVFRPPSGFWRGRLPNIGFMGVHKELLSDFESARANGFAYIDSVPTDANSPYAYTYALFPVFDGEPLLATPVASTAIPTSRETENEADIKAAESIVDAEGLQLAFEVDAQELAHKSIRFKLLEQRGSGPPVPLHNWISVNPHLTNWTYVCHRPKKPYPDVVTLLVEDPLGYQKEIAITLSKSKPVRQAVATRRCEGPVVMQVPSPAYRPPPPPPPRPKTTGIDFELLERNALFWLDLEDQRNEINERIALWYDGDVHAQAPKSTQQPVLRQFGTGRALAFDNDQSFRLEHPVYLKSATIFVVGINREDKRDPGIILGAHGRNKDNQLRWESHNQVAVVGPDSSMPPIRSKVGNTRVPHVLVMRYDNQSISFWYNQKKGKPIALPPARAGFAFNAIGSHYSGDKLNGDIAALIAIPRPLSDSEIKQVVAHLRERYLGVGRR